jgi:hypothetical protein
MNSEEPEVSERRVENDGIVMIRAKNLIVEQV